MHVAYEAAAYRFTTSKPSIASSSGNLTPVKGGPSRRILPGFFMAVDIMMGANVTEQCRDRAMIVFDRVNAGVGDSPDWRAFNTDPEDRILATDAVVSPTPASGRLGRWTSSTTT